MSPQKLDRRTEAATTRLKNPAALRPCDRLRALREALGLSQEKAGEQLGVSDATFNDWEKGKKKPFDVNPRLIEEWSRNASKTLGLRPSATILADEWLTESDWAAIKAVASGVAPPSTASGAR